MKQIITLIFLSLVLVACKDCKNRQASTSYDKRCKAIQDEAYKKGVETKVCFEFPKDSEKTWYASEVEKLHPDKTACDALYEEANKKCEVLPSPGPGDIVQTSGSAFYKDGKPIMIDGRPVDSACD